MKIFEKIYDDIDKTFGDFTKKTTKNSDIKSMYDFVGDLNEGLAQVILKGKYGYIDKTGKEVIPCIFDGITYNNQMFYVKFHGKYGCINQLGDMFVPCIFDIAPCLEDGKIKMVNDGISTIYSIEGEIIY